VNAVLVTFGRTVCRARRQFSTVLAVAAFLSVSAVLFALGAEAAEGSSLPLSAVWASCVAPVLPALVALLSMDAWSGERQSGRVDELLSVAVRERDYVLGKFFGIVFLTLVAVLLSLVSTLTFLLVFASGAVVRSGFAPFAAALFALMLQGFLWCAAGLAFSAMFRSVVASLSASLLTFVVLPRLVWRGLLLWSDAGRPAFGEMPLDAHVVDMATGIVPLGTVVAYLVAGIALLFVATKLVVIGRFVGSGSRRQRFSTLFAVVLALAVLVLTASLSVRVNPSVEISDAGASVALTSRTRGVLQESSGRMTVTCFLSRKDARFREIGRFLRLLQRESEFVGGARIELRYVDPHWDIGAAERLVRRGVGESSLVFEKGNRLVSVPIDREFGERVCTATIGRLMLPLWRRNVYWTVGHGESAFDSYRPFGMSDIARDLSREGYLNVPLDLATSPQVPSDCALVLVAGAKDDFSRAEIGRLDAYLREGGRLLVLSGSSKSDGVNSLLSSWGLRPQDVQPRAQKTMSGSDVVVSTFADHPVSAPLKNSRIVLERPVSFQPSAVAGTGAGADRIGYAPIAFAGTAAVVASVERGAGAGQDLALRPTRIIALGDASFAMNGQLAVRACANRDFFLNCVSFLSGSDTYGSGEGDSSVFRMGLDRSAKLRFVIGTALVVPLALLVFLSVFFCRRSRT